MSEATRCRGCRDNPTLSKRDFENLGCEDVPGPRLRARVFLLEGLVAELALTLEDALKHFVHEGDHLDEMQWLAVERAREVLATARESCGDRHDNPMRTRTVDSVAG